jgi:MFS family permease
LLRLHVPPERRGRVFGIFGATMGLAAAGGPALGGEIVHFFGWRAIFLANLPFLALAALMLRLYPVPVTEPRTQPSQKNLARSLDFAGIGILALSLTLLILSSKADGGRLVALLSGAIVAAIIFVAWEMKAATPIFDPHLFTLQAFAAGTGIIALQNFAMYGLLFELPQFFSVFRETTPRDVGYMLFVMMIGMVIAAPLGGQLTDRAGPRRAAQLGVVPLLAGSVMLWHLGSFSTPRDALPALLLFGFGMGLCSAPAQSAAMSAVEPAQAGMAAGVSSTMRYLGGIISILVMGVVLGNDAVVSVGRHELMVKLFTSVIVISALASFRLPGLYRQRSEAS